MSTLGERIRLIRADLTQDAFAEYLDVDRSTLSSWEINRREPDLQTMIKIAQYGKVSLDWLAGLPCITRIPIYGTEDFLNLTAHPGVDLAIRIDSDDFSRFGIRESDYILVRKTKIAERGEPVVLKVASRDSILIDISSELNKDAVIGVVTGIIKTSGQVNDIGSPQRGEDWHQLIQFAKSNNLSPQKVQEFLKVAVDLKNRS